MPSNNFKYKAFISYSHQDSRWANWLHKKLETYRVPKAFAGKRIKSRIIPERLFPIFRDREELPTSHELGKVINQALRDSCHLVVICSPRSAKSLWVNEEIKQFKRLGKSDQVLCFIVDGEPNATDRPELSLEECFPEAAKFEIGEDDELSTIRTEPIAADAREGKDGKRNALLKLLAGLLGVGFDDLKQRDLARKQKRQVLLSSLSLSLTTVMAGLTLWALDQQQQAVTARNAETEQRKLAEVAMEDSVRENYFSTIALAQAKINDSKYDQAKELLWTTPKRYRRWEWGRILQLCHPERLTLKGHEGPVYYSSFSSDGKLLATAGDDGTAKIWDAVNGKELFSMSSGEEPVFFAALSHDSRHAITLIYNQTAKVWNLNSREERFTLAGAQGKAAFFPDGKKLITGGPDGTAIIWSTETGEQLRVLEALEGFGFTSFSQDGRLALTRGRISSKVLEVESGKELVSLMGLGRALSPASFSFDGSRVITALGHLAKVWSLESSKERHILKGHERIITSVSFSPQGNSVVTSGHDHTARVWDFETGSELYALKGHESGVSSARFSPEGKRVVTASFDGSVKIWDVPTVGQKVKSGLIAPLSGLPHRDLAISSDGRFLVTVRGGHSLKIRHVQTGEAVLALNGNEDAVFCAAFSHDGQRVVVGDHTGTARIWNAQTGSELMALKAHKNIVFSVTFSKDGQRVMTVGQDYLAKVWDTADGQLLLTLNGGDSYFSSAAFSPDGNRLVTGSFNHLAKVWDAVSGNTLLTLQGHNGAITDVAFSLDGQDILTASHDATAKIWDAVSGKERSTLKGHERRVSSMTSSPDGDRVITTSFDQTVKVWDMKTGKELLTLPGTGRLIAASISPDGMRAITENGPSSFWEAIDPTLNKKEFFEDQRKRYAEWADAIIPQSE